jgi:hypothetical protein
MEIAGFAASAGFSSFFYSKAIFWVFGFVLRCEDHSEAGSWFRVAS